MIVFGKAVSFRSSLEIFVRGFHFQRRPDLRGRSAEDIPIPMPMFQLGESVPLLIPQPGAPLFKAD